MADQKLTQLTALATLSADDLFYVVDDPAGAALSRKMAASVLDSRYLQSANNLSDLANAATARSNLSLVIGTNVQAWNTDLDTIAGLAKTDGNFIVGDGAAWVVESGATARTSLGLGSLAVLNSPLPIANGGSGQVTQQAAIDALTNVAAATDEYVLTKDTATGNAIFKAAPATGAPVGATYIVQTSDGTLMNEQALSALATGLLKNTTGTGVLSIGVKGTDYPGLDFANTFTSAQTIDGSADVVQLTVKQHSTQNEDAFQIVMDDGTKVLGIRARAGYCYFSTGVSNDNYWFEEGFSVSQGANILNVNSGGGIGFETGGHLKLVTTSGQSYVKFREDTRSFGIGGNFIPSATIHGIVDDAVTGAITNVQILGHNTSGTPAVGYGTGSLFQGKSSTDADQNMGRLYWLWPDAAGATHATRRTAGVLTAFSVTTERECLSWEATSTEAKLSFLGAARIARPATYTLAATATRTMPTPEATFTGQDNVQIGNVYARFADLATLQTRLDSVEGVLRQLIIDLASTSGYGLLAAS